MKKYGARLAVMIVVVVLIIAVSAHFLGGKAGLVSNTAGVVKSPVQSAVTSVVDWFESLYGYIYEYDKLAAENEALKEQLAEAQAEARLGAAAVEENENLRDLLGFAQRHSDFVLESVRVVNWNSSNWSSSFTISKGENSGLQVGQPVITSAGELVGQISEIGDTWANVKTLIDVETNVGVLVGEAGNPAMAIGDFTLMQDGKAKIYHLTEGSALLEGDVALSSGSGSAFPQGLVVGYIESVLTEAGGQMPYGVLTPSCDLNSLSQVFIIKEFVVVE